MLSRREFLTAVGLAMAVPLSTAAVATTQATKKPKLATVTLLIDGMT